MSKAILNQEEKELIYSQTKKIILYSQAYPFGINVTPLLEKWESNKSKFIELFGGKTRVRSAEKIKIHLSEKEKDKVFEKFLGEIFKKTNNLDLRNFIAANSKDGFFSNTVLKGDPECTIRQDYEIREGSKLLKSFKKFIKNPEMLRKIQDLASTYIQKTKIEGYIYLSVDPRDFLTLSDNNSNWTSCHRLDGDYRAGNLNYMVDKTTVIAYLANKSLVNYQNLPEDVKWSNKKWRMLLHINLDKCIYFNKQYPFSNSKLVTEVLNMIDSITSHRYINTNTDTFSRVIINGLDRAINLGNQLVTPNRIYSLSDIIDYSEYWGFQDLTMSENYCPLIMLEYDNACVFQDEADNVLSLCDEFQLVLDTFGIKIGEEAPCVCCGRHPIQDENTFLCKECKEEKDAKEDFFLKCDYCGKRIFDKSKAVKYLWDYYCKKCYNLLYNR